MPDSGSHHVWRKIDFVVLLISQNEDFFCQCPAMVLDRKDFPGVGRILRRVLWPPLRARGAWWIAVDEVHHLNRKGVKNDGKDEGEENS